MCKPTAKVRAVAASFESMSDLTQKRMVEKYKMFPEDSDGDSDVEMSGMHSDSVVEDSEEERMNEKTRKDKKRKVLVREHVALEHAKRNSDVAGPKRKFDKPA
jgi:hypothetical protein